MARRKRMAGTDNFSTTMRKLCVVIALSVVLEAAAQECTDLSGPSSWIGWVCYKDGTLQIQMQQHTYNFCGVPYSIYQGITRAYSPGTYYDQYIRGRYRCAGY